VAGQLNHLHCIEIEMGADGNFDYVVTRGFEVVDILAITNINDGGTTATPQTNIGGAGLAALTGAALATDTVDDMERAGTIVTAQMTMATRDTLRMIQAGSAGAADQADVYTWVIPTTWISG